MISNKRKALLLILGVFLGAIFYFAMNLWPGFSQWKIEATSARQVLGDIAKISGTILALFTTSILFLARERPKLIREAFTLGYFFIVYTFFVGLIFLSFWDVLRLRSEAIFFSEIMGEFVLLFIVLYMLAGLVALVYFEIEH